MLNHSEHRPLQVRSSSRRATGPRAINTDYHVRTGPIVDTIEMKGRGLTPSRRARVSWQTGEYDVAMEASRSSRDPQKPMIAARGRVAVIDGGPLPIRPIFHRSLDRNRRREGEPQGNHPTLSTRRARRYQSPSRPRLGREFIYGRTVRRDGEFPQQSHAFPLEGDDVEFISRRQPDPRPAVLEARPDACAEDARAEIRLPTSINTPRQKTQAIVKQACQKAGIYFELKS